MANPTTLTGVPAQVIAGDTWKWRILDPIVGPAPLFNQFSQVDGWALKYAIAGLAAFQLPGGTSTVVYQTSGDDIGYWVALVTLADSATLTIPTGQLSGRYRLIGRVVGSGAFSGQEYTVSDDVLVVLPNPRTAVAAQFQTQAEKMLAIIDAEITARITGTGSSHESYQIGGRALNKITIEALHRLRGRYAARVYREKTGRVGERVAADFTRPSRSSPSSYGSSRWPDVD